VGPPSCTRERVVGEYHIQCISSQVPIANRAAWGSSAKSRRTYVRPDSKRGEETNCPSYVLLVPAERGERARSQEAPFVYGKYLNGDGCEK
jgi:hypothetical protein